MFASDPGVLQYIRSMEEKLQQLSDDVNTIKRADNAKQAQITMLTTDVTSLKKQLQTQDTEAAAKQAQVEMLTAQVEELQKQQQSRVSADAAKP